MNAQPFSTLQTQTQGREVEDNLRQSLLARPHRSLNLGPGQLRHTRHGFVPLRLCFNFLVVLLVLLLASVSVISQEVEDTIRIKTRVVFPDALVKDQRTSLPISNLSPDNFEVFDNGKPRSVSYFTREGQARKPLALVLILDVRADGAGRFLKRPEILKSMESELAKLPPGDEVAIMVMDIGEDEKRIWLTVYERPNKTLGRSCSCPGFSEEESYDVGVRSRPKRSRHQPTAPPTNQREPIGSRLKPSKGKNGATVTPGDAGGSVNVKQSKQKVMTVSSAVSMTWPQPFAMRFARLNRQTKLTDVVGVGIRRHRLSSSNRDATEQLVIRNNVIFNSLTVDCARFQASHAGGKPLAG